MDGVPGEDPVRRWGQGLQPLPESWTAADELEPDDELDLLLETLIVQGRRVQELVPDCIGLSLAVLSQGVTLTLVASGRDIALLDAIQYVHSGPCVRAAATGERTVFDQDDDVVDGSTDSERIDESWETEWRAFAVASAAAGVRSTLTLPLITDGRVRGSVNLYAASSQAFEGWHDEIAQVFSAWAPGAVTNADLSFSTRDRAREAPRVLRETKHVDAAVGLLMVSRELPEEAARQVLSDAAARAGVGEHDLALALLELNRALPPGDR